MLVYLWYTLITPASVGMPVITIIYIVQTCSYLPNAKITSLTFTHYQTVLLDNLWNTHTTSRLGDQVKKKLLH